MRKLYVKPFALILSLVCTVSFVHATRVSVKNNSCISCSLAKEANDSSLVWQACLDMPELQQYYPKNTDGSYMAVYVMQFPVAFPAGMAVSKFQQEIIYESRGDIYTNKREAFFIVKSFAVAGNAATVTFDYNYHYTTSPATFEVTLTLQKTGSDWAITNTVTSQR